MAKQDKTTVANTMISDRFEVFHVDDVVSENSTLFHYHDFFEIHCTLKGEGIFYIDGQEYPLTPGTITLIAPNDLHRIVTQTTASFERVYIFATPQYLQTHSTATTDLTAAFQSLGVLNNRFLHLDPQELRQLLQPLDQQPSEEYGADLTYEFHFLEFLIHLTRISRAHDPLPTAPGKSQDDLISQVINYINENLAADLSLERISEAFFTNKFHLSREFKKSSGITLHSYILKKRLLYSKQLLRKYRSANQVYQLCGFNSYTHFLRSFKQEFQITPKEFLKRDAENHVVAFKHYEDKN